MRWLVLLSLFVSLHLSAAPEMALITQDNIALRAAPKNSAIQQAALWQGDLVEIRGQTLDYVQVYDYQRERGGYVHLSQLRRTHLATSEATEFLAVLRHLREQPGSEALGFAYAAAYLKMVPARELAAAEVFSAIAHMAERLAQRASGSQSSPKVLAHLEVAARYGIRFLSVEHEGKMTLCYDGEAYRYLLNNQASSQQQAQAALGLSRADCLSNKLPLRERYRLDEQHATLLQAVDSRGLAPYQKNQLLLRRADVWSRLAYQHSRFGHQPQIAANQALAELASVNPTELAEQDLSAYNNSMMRVNANRWASRDNQSPLSSGLHLKTSAGQAGETCVSLYQAQQKLLQKCSYGLVWLNSSSLNREQTALTLAVQTLDGWRELWLFHQTPQGWQVHVLPPGAVQPELGYIEFAGWVPGGKQVIVAREWRSEGKYKRSYEVLDIGSGNTLQQASQASSLGALNRWADLNWKQHSLSVR